MVFCLLFLKAVVWVKCGLTELRFASSARLRLMLWSPSLQDLMDGWELRASLCVEGVVGWVVWTHFQLLLGEMRKVLAVNGVTTVEQDVTPPR